MYDDGWIAHYAATCFCDDSLLWYSDLDEEIRNSWSKLRKALLEQYLRSLGYSLSPSAAPTLRNLRVPQGPAAGPPPQASSFSNTPPDLWRGKIEILLPNYGKTIGFLAYRPGDGVPTNFVIVEDLTQAQLISFPKNPQNTPFHIQIEGNPTSNQYPYLGLALKNEDGTPSHVVPASLPYGYRPGTAFRRQLGDPHAVKPSAYCSRKPVWETGNRRVATWIFKACSILPRHRRSAKTSDSQERASSAIWNYDGNTNQLSMMWMMDDDTERELRVIVPDGSDVQNGLHIHRPEDWDRASPVLDELMVELYFIPESS
ncbi:hypothetical protein M407DRAFT_19048 [Tulasnella calospora MUT 4182]|uniref:Uncharacterized protein n=1 Tax=Tulasnella calospora MUT 4182 TaxID=1051891 RepID=A0A0C3ME29_9AGAM|nr:hypothetical protein M407DRAFT_19048 [Tulasnella calospora MUT 4182]